MPNPLSESTFVELTNQTFNQSFSNGNDASTWLTNNGYWNSYVSVTPTPTATLPLTPTPTPSVTTTQTPTGTPHTTQVSTATPTPTPTSTPNSGGWFFYYTQNTPVASPPNNNGDTAFIYSSSPNGTYNPNYTGGTFNLYFNNNNSVGTSYLTQFQGLDTTGGTITMTQGSSTAIYSGDASSYTVIGSYLQLSVTGSTQLIQSASTPFVSGSSITILVNGGSPTPTPTATSVTPTPTPTSGTSGNFNVTISQVGNDVVWNGAGYFNLAALTSNGTTNIGGGYNSGAGAWAIGPNVTVDTYSGTISNPGGFGTSSIGVTSNDGSTFGILPGGSGLLLYVPLGYVSNTDITGSSTYANTTIAAAGLTPGVYTWSWGTGGNSSTLVMTIN
jgi:hypothetical protein